MEVDEIYVEHDYWIINRNNISAKSYRAATKDKNKKQIVEKCKYELLMGDILAFWHSI